MFLDDLIAAIYRMEGSDSPNSVNQHMIRDYGLYDPGHLTFANQPGATPVTIGGHTWAGFATPEAANAAMANQISLDASRGHTLETFISKYAPSFENNTGGYITTVAGWLGVDPNGKLADLLGGSTSPSGGSGGSFGWDSLTADATAVLDSMGGSSINWGIPLAVMGGLLLLWGVTRR